MTRTYHHGALADALVEGALALIEEGNAVPSLREVARRAGVSAMAPYRHFEDRAALLSAVAARGFEALGVALTHADHQPTPNAALVAQGRAYIVFACSHPLLFRLMFNGAAPAPTPDDHAYSVLAKRAAEIAPLDETTAALACWSMVHGLAMLAIDQRLGGIDLVGMEAAIRLLVDGIIARQA